MSASRYYSVKVTVTVDGDERDVFVGGFVECGWDVGCPNGFGAILDGDADVMINGTWCPIDSVNLGEGDAGRIADALCETALEDDSDQCVDDDDREAAE